MAPKVPYFRRLVHALRSLPAGGVLAVTVGFLLQLSLGGLFTFGNLTTYLTSYLRLRGGQDVGYGQTVWVGTLMGMTEGLALLPGSVLYQRYGPRSVVLLGGVMASGAIALTSLTVNSSLLWVTMTYSVLNGLGVGLVYSVPVLVGCKWFPDRKGLITGLVLGGYSLGGILFTTIQTSFLNPGNASPEEDGFFHDAALLDRVPHVFLLQAGVSAALQLTAVLGLRDPPERNAERRTSECRGSKRSHGPSERHRTEPVEKDLAGASNIEQRVSYSLKEALTKMAMYQLLMGFAFNKFTMGLINALWKAFGQTFIRDDHFLELVGSGSSVFSMMGCLIWGSLGDIFGYKPVMVLLTGLFCALTYTLQVTYEVGKGMYLLWVWSTYFCFSGTFSIVVTGVVDTFGHESTGPIFGAISLFGALTGPLVALLTNLLLDRYGFSLMFLLGGIATTAGLVATLTFTPRVERTVR